ncbi:hypothetical protein TEA_025074 [Camellia sinensis var. sinensis]|uniref:Uncharacterized protein n=2 Tax=Camellia sinensis TaxID=4442 RepID=A0A4S4EZJ7_CAMSN|nr:hypothetical protein TEA_025074 [Camellia sinensis var. sinensis]
MHSRPTSSSLNLMISLTTNRNFIAGAAQSQDPDPPPPPLAVRVLELMDRMIMKLVTMLIRSSLTGSIEAALAFVSDREKGDWKPDAETWHKRRKCEKNPQDGWEEVIPTMELKRNIDDTCSLNFARSCSQLSNASTMSENSTPAFVYRRRKLERNSVSVFPVKGSAKPSDSCISAISSDAPSLAAEGHIVSVVGLESEVVRAPVMTLANCRRDALVSKPESINGCLDGGELGSKAAPQGDSHRALDFGCVNDSYSSSKSNVELGSPSLRIEVDDTGECSSSCELVVEGLQDDLSEKDICILILRWQGQLEGVCPIRSQLLKALVQLVIAAVYGHAKFVIIQKLH